MQFKDLESHNLCAQCFTGLDKTSYDSSNQVTMCAAKHRAINFDALMELYAKLHKISLPSSADAFLCVGEDEGLLIEFKNGFVDKNAARQIAKKAYDSILILSEFTGKSICDYRDNLTFVLVVNEAKNEGALPKSVAPSSSEALSGMVKSLSAKGGESFVPYGLHVFKGYCFKEVRVVGGAEFERDVLGDVVPLW